MLQTKMSRKKIKHKILGVLCAPFLLSGCVSQKDDWACMPAVIDEVYVVSCQWT
jgi:uncharacterized lipoprotein YajG